MKTLILLVVTTIFATVVSAQTNVFPSSGRVGIGTTVPDTSAILDVKSIRQGILIPRMTLAQRDSIYQPAVSLLIYQTDVVPGFYYYSGTLWTPLNTTDANTSLSNLQATSINVALVPSTDNTLSLGSSTKKWNTLYSKTINIDGEVFVSNGNNKDSANTLIGATHNTTNTAGGNVLVGTDAGKANTSGFSNTFVGRSAGKANTTGFANSFYGMNAGLNNTTGPNNTLVGYGAGQANTTGSDNTLVGYKSGIKNTTGGFNAFFGDLTGNQNTSGAQNVYCGARSGINNTGSNNTCIGYSSGADITSGQNNTFIGNNADALLSSVTNSIAIGYFAEIDQSNAIRIGNSSIGKIGIGRSPSPDDILDFQSTTAKLTNGGVWTNASDKKLKNNFQDLDATDILNKVNQLHIQRWHYIADRDVAVTHIGPVAQDFHALFGVGDDTTISTIDPSGVALLAIQALTQKDKQKDAAISEQQSQIDQLQNMVSEIEQSLSQCCLTYQNSKKQSQINDIGDGAYLEQNVPNPFSSNTTIKCFLPSNTKSAVVKIYTLDGKELKSFPLSNTGMNEITIDGSSLAVGEYIYSLVIDGNKLDSKRMVLTY